MRAHSVCLFAAGFPLGADNGQRRCMTGNIDFIYTQNDFLHEQAAVTALV
jgi:hypothetical protein